MENAMTPWELMAAGLLYLSVAWRYAHHGDIGMAIAFVCYAGANVGFVISAVSK